MADDEFGEFLTTPAEHVLTPTHLISYGLSAALGAAAPVCTCSLFHTHSLE
jgi:hypothetical protein